MFGYKDENSDSDAIKSPMTGKVIPLSEVNDAAFARESMGKRICNHSGKWSGCCTL